MDSRTSPDGSAPHPRSHVGDAIGRSLETNVEKWVYGAVSLLAIIEVYRWVGTESFLDAYAVLLGPAIAIALAHFYAAAIEAYSRQQGQLRHGQLLELLRHQRPFLSLTVPPLVVLALFQALGLDLRRGLVVSSWVLLGSVALIVVAVSRRRGLSAGQLVVVTSGVVAAGLLVVALQVLLKPH